MRVAKLGAFAGGLVLAAGVAGEARASGISVARFGGEHGHPTTTNATAIYYNPAGIGMSDGIHLFVDGNFAWRKVSYQHDRSSTDDPAAPDGANDGRAKLFNILGSPMLGVTGKFGDFAVGAGFYTPFGGQSEWDKNEAFKDDPTYPGPYDGVQRWYVMNGTIRSSFITGAAAYHLRNARLSIGLSGNLILSKTSTVRAKTAAGDNELASEGRAYLDVTGTDWSMGVGLLYEAIEKKLWLGASYQSRPNFSGMKPMTGKQVTFLAFPGGASSENDEDVELWHDIPDVYRLGGRYRPAEDLELRLFGDYTRWSVLERHVVKSMETDSFVLDQKRDWKDTWGVRAGVSKWLSKPFEGFVGAGFSSNAVPDETLEPGLADWDGFSFTAGGRYQILEKLHAALSYTQLIYLPRDTTGKSVLTVPPGTAPPSPDSGGSYKQMVGVVNVNVDVAF